MFLEHTGEMLGVFEAEEIGGFGDGLSVMQKGDSFLHDEVADDDGCCLAGGLANEVAEIVGRKEQFLCTITDSGQTEGALAAFIVIAVQQVVESFQQIVVSCGFCLKLTLVENRAIFQYQFEVSDDDAAQVFVIRL